MAEDGNRNQDRSGGSDEHSLKEREYRGAHGDVHHHTNSYMDRHESGGRDDDDGNRGGQERGSGGGDNGDSRDGQR